MIHVQDDCVRRQVPARRRLHARAESAIGDLVLLRSELLDRLAEVVHIVVLASHLRDDDAARRRRLRPALANGRNSAGLVKRAELRPGIEVGMIRGNSILPLSHDDVAASRSHAPRPRNTRRSRRRCCCRPSQARPIPKTGSACRRAFSGSADEPIETGDAELGACGQRPCRPRTATTIAATDSTEGASGFVAGNSRVSRPAQLLHRICEKEYRSGDDDTRATRPCARERRSRSSATSTESAGDTRCTACAAVRPRRGLDARVSDDMRNLGVSAASFRSLPCRAWRRTRAAASPRAVQIACERFAPAALCAASSSASRPSGNSTRCIRPGQRTLATCDDWFGPERHTAVFELFEQTDGHNGVVHLMIAGEREPHLAVVAHRSSQRESLAAVGMRLAARTNE